MRIDPINSWLSRSLPIGDFYPVSRVGPQAPQISTPAKQEISRQHTKDTIGPAPSNPYRASIRVTKPTISEEEMSDLLALIHRQWKRTDVVLSSFPGLLNA